MKGLTNKLITCTNQYYVFHQDIMAGAGGEISLNETLLTKAIDSMQHC